MMQKDFWRKSTVAVIGGGSWGTVLAQLLAQNCNEVRVWVRDDEVAREINATRVNADYLPGLQLNPKIKAFSCPERTFENGLQAVVWALPSTVCRAQARALAPHFRGDEIVLHASKGVEEGTLKRISVLLREELPCPRVGVISGPNLADEISRNEPAGTVVASDFEEVIEAGVALLTTDRFRVYTGHDVIGVEWAGTLKNIFAIASGALDAMKMGWNARAMLITRALAEMVRFGVVMGAKQETFLGMAAVGDLLATCSSPLSRNYRVGMKLAQGEKIDEIIKSLGSTAEGVKTARSVHEFARERKIDMPITAAVYTLLQGEKSVEQVIQSLMIRPSAADM